MSIVYYRLTRGANFTRDLLIRDKVTGNPISLVGLTATLFEVSPTSLQSSMTVIVADAANGRLRITCPWSGNWPSGTGAQVQFRVILSDGRGYGPIGVYLK
jgi:hypothetical protein